MIPDLPDQVFARGASLFESRDPEETRAHMLNVFSSHRLSVVGSSQGFRAKVLARKLGSLTLSTLSFGAEVTLDQEPSRDFLLVSTQVSGQAHIQVGDSHYSGGRGLVMVDTPYQPVRKHFSADSRRIHLRFDTRRVEAACADLLGKKMERPLHFSPFLPFGSAVHAHWMALLQLLISYVDQQAHCSNQQLYQMTGHLESAALLLLLNEHDHSYRDRLFASPRPVVPGAVVKAEQFMALHYRDFLSLDSIAAAAQVSVRSLTAAFRQYRRTTVMGALQTLRLQAAQKALKSSDATVAEVAMQCGFMHLGRFARSYQQFFGRLPSEERS